MGLSFNHSPSEDSEVLTIKVPDLATEISPNHLFSRGDEQVTARGPAPEAAGLIVMCGNADVLMEMSSKQLSHYRQGRDNQSCLQNL